MYAFYNLVKKVIHNRYMIKVMAFREIKTRYVGSIIGLFWSVIHPIVMVFIYYFIFSIGFKAKPANDIPFIVWFFCAFAPWTTFNEMVGSTTNSVVVHSALIKRTLFPSETLPFIYLVSSGINHMIMIGILFVMMMIFQIELSIYNLQFLYYWFAMIVMMLGFGWFLSSVNVFFRDTNQLVGVIFQMWFWGTPIFWDLGIMSEKAQFWLKLNPMYYIVEGYRESFLYHRPFWENQEIGLYYWGLCLFIFLIGGWVFRRLKSEFTDVL